MQLTPGLRQPIRLEVDLCAVALKSGNEYLRHRVSRGSFASAKFFCRILSRFNVLFRVIAVECGVLNRKKEREKSKKSDIHNSKNGLASYSENCDIKCEITVISYVLNLININDEDIIYI